MFPIADMFTAIRNALLIGKEEIVVPSSKFKIKILEILKEEKYISDYKTKKTKNKGFINISLKYIDKKPAITKIKSISSPGLRVYTNSKKIPRPLQGMGLAIISTPIGVMSGRKAYKRNLGGEVICEIY